MKISTFNPKQWPTCDIISTILFIETIVMLPDPAVWRSHKYIDSGIVREREGFTRLAFTLAPPAIQIVQAEFDKDYEEYLATAGYWPDIPLLSPEVMRLYYQWNGGDKNNEARELTYRGISVHPAAVVPKFNDRVAEFIDFAYATRREYAIRFGLHYVTGLATLSLPNKPREFTAF